MTNAPKGTGSLRERRPGVWEIRIAAGTDPVTGRVIQRSVTLRGTADEAEAYRRDLAAEYARRRAATRAAPLLTVGELLERWLLADHPWRPSTWVGYRSTARQLASDRELADQRVVSLTPRVLRAVFDRWSAAGATTSVVAGRFRALRSAIGWAYDERIIDHHPIRNMRGPGRLEPRRPLTDDHLRAVLSAAETNVLAAVANDTGGLRARQLRQYAEQDLLLVRLAADGGARRGELAALQFGDRDGRVLHVCRAVSAGEVGPTKSRQPRTLTLGASTARLWETLESDWRARARHGLGPWVFARDNAHQQRLAASTLDHRFRRLRDRAGVPGASLHRLRHNVATFLVGRGEILQAQARLGHRDAATTLREYAYALPLTDGKAADAINDHLDRLGIDADEPTEAPTEPSP
jgi:integrase